MLSATTGIYCPDQCIKDPDPLNSFYSIGLHKQIPVIMIQEYCVKKVGRLLQVSICFIFDVYDRLNSKNGVGSATSFAEPEPPQKRTGQGPCST